MARANLALVVDMERLPETKRDFEVRGMVLNALLGRKCTICNLKYEDPADIKSHGIISGYFREDGTHDTIGRDCWPQYVAKYGTPEDRAEKGLSLRLRRSE